MISFLRGNPRYLRYWMSTWASELGDWIRNMTLMYVVLDMSGESAVALSIMTFCEFAPIVVFGFLVGTFADRWNRKRTILGAILFRVAMMVYFIGAITIDSLPMMYVGAVLASIGTLFFRAAAPAFTMQFVPQEDRKMAANLRQMSMSTMLLIGAPIGALLYMKFGQGALVMTTGFFLIAWLLVASIRVDAVETPKKDGTVSGVWLDMREGFRYAWGNRVVRPILLSSVLFGFGIGLINVLEVFVTTEFLGLPKEMMSVLVSIQGVGMLVASLLFVKVKLSMEKMISYGMIVSGLGLAGMVLYPNFYVTAAALVLFAFGIIGMNIGTATLMQTKVAFEYQGRTGMTVSTVLNGCNAVALIASGWLHKLFTVQPVIAAGGLLVAAGGVVCMMIFARIMSQEAKQAVSVQG